LRNTGVEHELLCEIDPTSIINKFAVAKSRAVVLKPVAQPIILFGWGQSITSALILLFLPLIS